MSDEIKKAMIEKLNQKIPREVVREREGGGGRTFSYLEGHYVIRRMNEIFGQGNWSYLAEAVNCVHQGDAANGGFSAHYIATVRVEVPALGCIFSDVGYGDGSDKRSLGKCHELAAKESVTDALKRCCKNLGDSMGLALYDKEQTNVEETPVKAAASTVKNTPAIGVAPSAGKSKSTVSAALSNREELNKQISDYAKVAVAKRVTDTSKIRQLMQDKFGADAKEKLTDAQAQEFLTVLQGLV